MYPRYFLHRAKANSGFQGISAEARAEPNQRTDLEREVMALYEETAVGLFRYALAATSDREHAEDAVQECFYRYMLRRRQGALIRRRNSFLYKCLREQLAIHLQESTTRHGPLPQDPFDDPRQRSEVVLRRAALHREASNLLTPRELDCIRLRAQGLRYEDIASALGIRCGTVGALLARAVCKLRSAFGCKES